MSKGLWEPSYESWRHGGYYVTNARYPGKAVGCVSNNYVDKLWRIVTFTQSQVTFPSRDSAARAEAAVTHALSNYFDVAVIETDGAGVPLRCVIFGSDIFAKSYAEEYAVQVYGMDKDEARRWFRENKSYSPGPDRRLSIVPLAVEGSSGAEIKPEQRVAIGGYSEPLATAERTLAALRRDLEVAKQAEGNEKIVGILTRAVKDVEKSLSKRTKGGRDRTERWVFTAAELKDPSKCKRDDEFISAPHGMPMVVVDRRGISTGRFADGSTGVDPDERRDAEAEDTLYVYQEDTEAGEEASTWRDVKTDALGTFVGFAEN